MIELLLLTILLFTFAFYVWTKYSPYLSFHNSFFFNWNVCLTLLRGYGLKNEPLSVYFFQRLMECCNKPFSKGVCVFWLSKPILLVYGPEAVKFFANEPSLIDKPWVYHFFEVLSKDGLFRSSGKRAKRQRKLIAPSFFPSMMKNYERTVKDHVMSLVHELRQLENQTAIDILEIIKPRTMMLLCEVALGIKISTDAEDSRINRFIKSITRQNEFTAFRTYRPWLYFDFLLPLTSEGRQFKNDIKEVHSIANQIIEEIKERYYLRSKSMNSDVEDKECKKSFGDVLFETHLKDPSFTLNDLRTEIVTLIIAGYDTSSYSLMWTLWLLGHHDDVQEKAYEEIKLINFEDFDYEDFRNITYLESIIKESLRLYPAVPLFGRQSQKDLYFENHRIPRGTTIFFFLYMLHRNKESFPEPDDFNPDRFLDSNIQLNTWKYIPFAESVRSCIGKNFALLNLRLSLAHVIKNFKIISITPKEAVHVSWDIMLKNSTPLYMKFVPR